MARHLPPPLVVACLALAGCLGPAAETPADRPSAIETPGGQAPAASSSPLSLTDDVGREVTLAAPAERIVSLAPSSTEIVCALDACDRLVGVTDFDDHPPAVAEVDDVVIGAQVDVERVVAAEPDLVLAAGNEVTPTAVIDQLTGLGVTVLTLDARDLDGVYADIRLVGAALGAPREAEALVTTMADRVEAVREAVDGAERPVTFYEVSFFEGTIYTAGEGSLLASLLALAGAEPVTGNARFEISLEELVAADPELILLGDATYDPTITPESVAAREGWSGISAVRDGRILPVADDVVITRPGPRIVEGLEALAALIHPERFP